MKIFLGMVVIIGSLVSLEWVALNALTSSLARELDAKATSSAIVDLETRTQGLYVTHRSGHSLGADYLQASGEDGDVFQPNAHTAGVQ